MTCVDCGCGRVAYDFHVGKIGCKCHCHEGEYNNENQIR
jgi:hypothetical protein